MTKEDSDNSGGFSRSKIDSEDYPSLVTTAKPSDSSYGSDAFDQKPIYRPPVFLIVSNIVFWIGLIAWWFWPT